MKVTVYYFCNRARDDNACLVYNVTLRYLCHNFIVNHAGLTCVHIHVATAYSQLIMSLDISFRIDDCQGHEVAGRAKHGSHHGDKCAQKRAY